MEVLQSINAATTAQLEFFSVAALISMILFSGGFVLGRSSKNREVRVPLEVIHALASARAMPHVEASAVKTDSKEDKIEDEIEHILDHVEHHEKDFKHAKDYTLHERE